MFCKGENERDQKAIYSLIHRSSNEVIISKVFVFGDFQQSSEFLRVE